METIDKMSLDVQQEILTFCLDHNNDTRMVTYLLEKGVRPKNYPYYVFLDMFELLYKYNE